LTLGVFLNRRCAAFDLEKSISLLVRSVSLLNWELLPGVDLVGVLLGSKEAAVSDSFSDPEGDRGRREAEHCPSFSVKKPQHLVH
jgi:hypothetical protein